jgi:hypothetical protein
VNVQELCAAVRTTRPYLQNFTRYDYAGAFGEYSARFLPAFSQALEESGDGEEAVRALAASLLDEMEAGWRRRSFFGRGAAEVDEKRMLTVYLTPMLLSAPEPACGALARTLCGEWAARHPEGAYEAVTFEEIRKGFRHVILGIEIPERDGEKKKDRKKT